MRTIRFGKTQVRVPVVSLGTWGHGGLRSVKGHSVGWSGHDDDEALRALHAAHEVGIDHWDTADVYGDGRAESLIGKALQSVPREAIFLASKVGWDPGPWGRYYHPEQIRGRLERSLGLVGTDHFDLYYFHHCDFGPRAERLDAALETMDRLREEGKFRFLGLSDWSAARILRHAPRVRPDVIQPYRSVRHDEFRSSGLRDWVVENDVGVAFFSPLRHGLLLGKHERPPEWPEGDHRREIPEFADPDFLAAMRACREAVERRFPEHPNPVLWALTASLAADTPGSCVLLGMRNESHVRQAGDVGDPIGAEEAAWVRRLYAEAAAPGRGAP